jgi:2-succinyl-5-enolpyruvyl-6-hydroxy-3-cyclohexene-1-carboxylate synthase
VSAAVQTLWTELLVATLADAGVRTCVVSPGSRSTPLVTALAAEPRIELPTIIDERAAAFYALGIARATNQPVALVCTSGSAAAHYLPALVEASMTGIPLIAITADRPPELLQCGASQTIDQIDLYGSFVREAFDLGPPTGTPLAMRALRRKIIQAITRARGPQPGPVHIEVPLRKPLEPAKPSTDDERSLARVVAELRALPVTIAAPRLVADDTALAELAAAIAAEPRGVIVAGALPAHFARDAALAFAARTGYPLLAESGSQLRFAPRPGVTAIDHFDLLLAAPAIAPSPRLVIQIGAEPVATAWSTAFAGATRYVLADHDWHDADSTARAVLIGDVAGSLAKLGMGLEPRPEFATAWKAAEARASGAMHRALASHPRSEGSVLRAVVEAAPREMLVQVGNSLPIRVIDQVCVGGVDRTVITQRGAAGIDGLIASAAGATRAHKPVLLILGDVSFAHDIGGLLAAREAIAPLVILVIDNGGGRIFDGLPVARTNPGASFERHFTTAPHLDIAAVAHVLGARAVTAATPAAAAAAIPAALTERGVTVIHAPVTPTGARDVRRDAIELLNTSPARASQPTITTAGVR